MLGTVLALSIKQVNTLFAHWVISGLVPKLQSFLRSFLGPIVLIQVI